MSCACYSQYLSERDFNAFKDLFTRFEVDQYIHYSTLAQLAGNHIYEEAIRNLTKAFNEKTPVTFKRANNRTKILLIDEVDIFSSDFYRETYNPSVLLQNEAIAAILEHIWKNKDTTLHNVANLEHYKRMLTHLSDLPKIIKSAHLQTMAPLFISLHP